MITKDALIRSLRSLLDRAQTWEAAAERTAVTHIGHGKPQHTIEVTVTLRGIQAVTDDEECLRLWEASSP